ncbi:hypothetical protein Nepgr_029517 [Nepenthes gracilis]|uniref:cyclin-dependent kinase n=1 Tax=Nepenthes gracilis TaxID=150966 RepID=A0AAD3Y554_NEPGR|nr:hypothetical protein Nepgr_029517 [Nepenthes gracilis]
MAAGRYGVFHDTEFADREPNYDTARQDSAYSKDEYDPVRTDRWLHVRELRERDRGRVRHKDIKEREVVNSGYRTSSSRSDPGNSDGSGRGPRICGYSVRIMEREPGELSTDGSDGADSESQVKNNVVSKLENGTESPLLTRKRKFSPIVWDRDDKEVKDLWKSRILTTTTICRPTQLLAKSDSQLPYVVPDEDVRISPVKRGRSQDLPTSPLRTSAEHGSAENALCESPVNMRYSSPQKLQQSEDKEQEQLEDEDYIPTRNISASRWAGDANSPADEGEISDGEAVPKKWGRVPLTALETRVNKRSYSPELGELKGEGSGGAKARSLDSEGSMHSRSSSGNCGVENISEKEEYMEMDAEHISNGTNFSKSDTNSHDENYSDETPEPPDPPKRTVNMLQGCRSVDEFERLNKIDEGTYGVVYRAKDRKTGEIVALKKVKMEKEREGFPLTSLREINILLSFHHPSIVDVKEVVVGNNLDSIFMVMEYMEHDLKGLMETMKQPFSQSEVKCLILQLLEGIKYLHDNWVLHRDLKTSNLLLNNQGELKICDFGLARQYGSPLKPYTHLVVTLWYRAPELLLGVKQYSTAIDMWSLGCIMAELLSKESLFNGKTEIDQLDKIFRILGTPNETIWPGFSKLPGVKVNFVKHRYNQLRKKFPATSFTGTPVLSDAGFDLLNRLLTYDPEKRITAEAALKHDWFQEVPLPKSKEFMPTFPAQHAQDRRMRRIMRSPDPLEEQRRKELQQAELGAGGLFGIADNWTEKAILLPPVEMIHCWLTTFFSYGDHLGCILALSSAQVLKPAG